MEHVWRIVDSRLAPWGSLLAAALLAFWLLAYPDTVRSLAWPARVATVVLGSWSLGGGFAHCVGLTGAHKGPSWLRPPWCWGGMAVLVAWLFWVS